MGHLFNFKKWKGVSSVKASKKESKSLDAAVSAKAKEEKRSECELFITLVMSQCT